MPTPRAHSLTLALTLGLLAVLAPAAPAAGGEAETLRALLDRHAAAVVPVDAVIRTEFQMGGQGDDQEASVEMNGVLVDPGGLVMVWNSRISSSRVQEMMDLVGNGTGHGGDFGLRMTPLSFEVHLPGRDEPAAAFLAASDSQLDVAFLQIEDPPAEPLPFVDLAAAAEPAVGQPLYGVNRLSGSFDNAPFVETGRVVGRLEKPRPAWIVEGNLQGLGLPAFDAGGRPVGVLTTVLSSVAAERTAAMFQGMGGLLNAGDGKTMGPLGVFLVSAAPVARAVELSKQQAAERLEERRRGGSGAAAGSEAERPEEGDGDAPDATSEEAAGEDGD